MGRVWDMDFISQEDFYNHVRNTVESHMSRVLSRGNALPAQDFPVRAGRGYAHRPGPAAQRMSVLQRRLRRTLKSAGTAISLAARTPVVR